MKKHIACIKEESVLKEQPENKSSSYKLNIIVKIKDEADRLNRHNWKLILEISWQNFKEYKSIAQEDIKIKESWEVDSGGPHPLYIQVPSEMLNQH